MNILILYLFLHPYPANYTQYNCLAIFPLFCVRLCFLMNFFSYEFYKI